MEPMQNYYCDITRRILSLIGQWPYQKRRSRLFRMTVMTVTVLAMNIPQVCKLIHCDGDLKCILGTLPSYLLVIIIVVKLYTCQLNSNKIKDLTDRLLSNWKKLEIIPEEYAIMKMYAANGRLLVLIYSSCCFVGNFVFVLFSLVPRVLDIMLPLNESRPVLLPYEAYYFVDEEEYFLCIFFKSLIVAQIAIVGLIAHDCMLLNYIEHACGVFAVAGFRSEHLVCEHTDITKVVNNNNTDFMYNQKVALCVHAHWAALKFAELLENTFSISFTIQIAIVTIGMSITLVQITLQSEEILDAIRYIMYIILQLVHLFIFSFQGQRLINHSLQIRDKIYNCSWYNVSAKSQRLLLHVMRRSLQPNVLSASRIYIFSLKSFTTVVQTSVSYFTVLASFQ